MVSKSNERDKWYDSTMEWGRHVLPLQTTFFDWTILFTFYGLHSYVVFRSQHVHHLLPSLIIRIRWRTSSLALFSFVERKQRSLPVLDQDEDTCYQSFHSCSPDSLFRFSDHYEKTNLSFSDQRGTWNNLYNWLKRQLYSFQACQQSFNINPQLCDPQALHKCVQNSFTVPSHLGQVGEYEAPWFASLSV